MMEVIEGVEERSQWIVLEMVDLFAQMFEHFGSESLSSGILVGMPFQ